MVNYKWLEDTTIYRGGYDVPKRKEHEECRIKLNRNTGAIDLNFKIASKGGGETHILVRIGEGDFPALLREIGEATTIRHKKLNVLSKDLASLKRKSDRLNLENIRSKTSSSD